MMNREHSGGYIYGPWSLSWCFVTKGHGTELCCCVSGDRVWVPHGCDCCWESCSGIWGGCYCGMGYRMARGLVQTDQRGFLKNRAAGVAAASLGASPYPIQVGAADIGTLRNLLLLRDSGLCHLQCRVSARALGTTASHLQDGHI